MSNASKILESKENFGKFSRTLYDVDTALKEYFGEICLPKLSYGDYQINVPVMSAEGEKWAQIQKYDYLRDKQNEIMCPILVFKRTSVTKDSTYPVGEMRNIKNPIIYRIIKKSKSNKDRYIKFTRKKDNEQPKYEVTNIILPDYVILTYEIIIWTDRIDHMNEVISSIIYSSGNFWGNDQVKFRIDIQDFSNISEISLDKDRLIKWSCTANIRTHILPEFENQWPQMWTMNTNKKITLTEKIM